MLLRIFLEGLPSMSADWRLLFEVLAIVTMTVGNIAALTQTNLKRMLAYSSIAHAGYLLIGVVAGTPRGVSAMLIYLAGLLVHAARRLRGHRDDAPPRRHRRRAEGFQRPVSSAAVCGVRDADVHAVAGRHSADGRLHGQVLAVRRGDRFRLRTGWR